HISNNPRRLLLQHAKALAKAELAHDVESKPTEQVTHIDANTALEGVVDFAGEYIDVAQDQIFHALQRCVRESCRENTTLPTVLGFADCIMGVVHAFYGRECRVELRLL